MNRFLDGIKDAGNYSQTEKGALGYRTSHNPILDMSFRIPAYRHDPVGAVDQFIQAYNFDADYALKFLFYVRDAREGVGEREVFRTILRNLEGDALESFRGLIPLIPEYGRWDDVFALFPVLELREDALELIRNQLRQDVENMRLGKSISQLAKWMPSINTSSPQTKKLALFIIRKFGMKVSTYRKALSVMREYLDVVERKMSSGKWSEIDYAAVPSKANLKYANAFLRKDTVRRREFLNDVLGGRAKVNASVVFPHEILQQISRRSATNEDILAQWKHLPNLMKDGESTLVVYDSSGSMTWSSGSIIPIEVARAVGLYCAERLTGPYKDKIVTFSCNPQYFDVGNFSNIIQKYNHLSNLEIIENTDIEKVFELVLSTAVENQLSQEELPKNILIISDMEFDEAQGYQIRDRLFDHLGVVFESHGYEMPHLIFWNVAGRTNTIPQYGDNTTLISGFSPNLLKVALAGKTTAWEQLKNVLDSPRYSKISQ